MNNSSPIPDSIKQQLLAQLCEQLDDAIFILDANLCYLSVNPAFEMMIGYNLDFLLGRSVGVYAAEFLSEQERAILADISNHLHSTGFYENSFSMATRYGQILECYITYRKVCIDDQVYYVGMVRDISTVVKDKEQLTHLLNFDQLTGLPNRKVFLSQVSELLMDSRNEVIIARFSIDRYRTLACTIGPVQANNLITQFAKRIEALKLAYLKCFSHFGGDDFALLFECSDARKVHQQLDRLMQTCEQSFSLSGSVDSSLTDTCPLEKVVSDNPLKNESTFKDLNIYLHLSIGISYFPKNDNQLIGLLTKAEKALQYVKEHEGDDVCWYHDNLDQLGSDSLQLEAELRMAIQNSRFIPYYQPKVTLATGEITGFEALVRWQHPTRGLLKPCDFIEAILQYKLSFELFCQMATQITEHLCTWKALGFNQYVCINADAAEFSHPDFFDFVSDLFSQSPIDPTQLHIEITESSLMLRHSNVKQQLMALKNLGVGLALDDFGTGYSSLSYLQEYPFDFIKIDKSFMLKIADNKTQQAIVKAILDLAKALDMGAIAEGIETEQQRNLLLAMGCTYGQGYWFSHPIPYLTATQMLTDQLTFR